jgi:hypothetical protein
VPARYVGRRLTVRFTATTVEVFDGGRLVARHERAVVVGRYADLAGLTIQTAPEHRSCVHIQPNTRTLTFHWGLPHLWLYRPGPTS